MLGQRRRRSLFPNIMFNRPLLPGRGARLRPRLARSRAGASARNRTGAPAILPLLSDRPPRPPASPYAVPSLRSPVRCPQKRCAAFQGRLQVHRSHGEPSHRAPSFRGLGLAARPPSPDTQWGYFLFDPGRLGVEPGTGWWAGDRAEGAVCQGWGAISSSPCVEGVGSHFQQSLCGRGRGAIPVWKGRVPSPAVPVWKGLGAKLCDPARDMRSFFVVCLVGRKGGPPSALLELPVAVFDLKLFRTRRASDAAARAEVQRVTPWEHPQSGQIRAARALFLWAAASRNPARLWPPNPGPESGPGDRKMGPGTVF